MGVGHASFRSTVAIKVEVVGACSFIDFKAGPTLPAAPLPLTAIDYGEFAAAHVRSSRLVRCTNKRSITDSAPRHLLTL
jgi:hypothetical protein